MPLHLEAFVPDNIHNNIAACMFASVNDCDVKYVSIDNTIIHLEKRLTDAVRREPFGSVIFTLKVSNEDKSLNIVDVDITLDNARLYRLHLIEKLPQSSEANEYYEAAMADEGGHLQIETVNRHAYAGEIEGTDHEFHLSAFPFVVNVYDDMSEINKRYNLEKTIMFEGQEMKISGLSERFMAPGSVNNPDSDETYTYFFGRVVSKRNIECFDFDEPFSFYIVEVDSGMGIIPVAMNPECFDLRNLDVGKIVEVRADIKADLGIYPMEKS